MMGFVVSNETAAVVLAGIDAAMDSRGLPRFWTAGSYPIHKGPDAGMVFMPADDQILSTPLRGAPPLTPRDFPEFQSLVALLGGLESRVEIPDEYILLPSQSEDP